MALTRRELLSPHGVRTPRGDNNSWWVRLAALVVIAFLAASTTPAAAAAAIVYRFADARIDEASGIGVGVHSPGVDYVQNDSGDSARFFAVNAVTGRTAATITVPGARNVDWEDLAVAPDTTGRSSVWLADIGDNDAVRSEVDVYRVDEPRIEAGARDHTVRTARPDVWRLRYPGGAVNAESFAVTPAGVGYVITKSLVGSSVVYRLPPRPDRDHVQTLVRVGAITFHARPTDVPLGEVGTLTATGAAFSRDGALLVVRTYADAFVWPVHDDDVAAALRHAPTRVPLPDQPQGEGVAVDGDRLLVDSEGVGTAVYAVPLPATLPLPPTTTAQASTPTPPSTARASGGGRDAHRGGWLVAGVVGGALVVAAAVTRRRRRAR